jgi:hypothetical protein
MCKEREKAHVINGLMILVVVFLVIPFFSEGMVMVVFNVRLFSSL